MRFSLASTAALLTLGLAASCAPTAKAPPAAPKPAAQAPAASRNCVDLARIAEARVVSDRIVDFHLRDGSVLRNSLPNACPGLGAEKAFTYSTSIQRLCTSDIITVIHTAGGPRTGASCGLGGFTAAPPAPAATN
ncbi:hypothetical protein ACFOMD_18225 [Sphingoaurantiacus capsulatus]|uniref:Lipoprotein n=1 Tax=Sphingoaurantiacus capsulatus TaxID=1771310 RepID=A0ABV7XIE0_9SPHN